MKYKIVLLLTLFFININCSNNTMEEKLKKFFEKEKVTILITDSGLGGLSVTTQVDSLINQYASFREANIIFFNSQPEDTIGYNGMKTVERKVEVFNDALEGMLKFNPDIILIACNTLSVIYDQTPFAKSNNIPPVIGIVAFGVDMLYSKMKNDTSSMAIIFGTQTTIEANSHKEKLIEKGIGENRIITTSCKGLPGAIEDGAHSEKTKSLISMYCDSTIQQIGNKQENVYIGLCCTHFGYSSDIFYSASQDLKNREVLDPNILMSQFVINKNKKYDECSTAIEIYSRAKLSDVEIKSIGELIKVSSPKTERALQNYNFKQDLFKFNSH
jgi:glutamate racemase